MYRIAEQPTPVPFIMQNLERLRLFKLTHPGWSLGSRESIQKLFDDFAKSIKFVDGYWYKNVR